MTVVTNSEALLDALRLILASREQADILVREYPAILDEEQCNRLDRIHAHYCAYLRRAKTSKAKNGKAKQEQSDKKRGRESNEEDDDREESPRRKQVPEMLKLSKVLYLDPTLETWLSQSNKGQGKAEDFLKVESSGQHLTALAGKPGDIFLACFDYAQDLDERIILDRVRWAFTMIFFSDLCKIINPAWTGRRWSSGMKDMFAVFVGKLMEKDAQRIAAVTASVERWSRHGLKLTQLCESFGEGSMFYLARHFSHDFLENKYRESGPVHDETFGQLEDRGLKVLSQRFGANDLGRNIRANLSKEFRQKEQQ